ncbi:MAG: NUDIX hydrolase [Candidatus Aenigmarchaeota archaeon]|nr:NUDIX hydrolase [Candidatus Aenigmarchaeota archaeon]
MDVKTPYLVVDAVVIKNKEILLVRREKKPFEPFEGYWALPGGFVERGEILKKAVSREVLEETGIKVTPRKIIGIYDDPKRDPRGHMVSAVFLCTPKGGKLKPQKEEVKEIRFFPVTEIRKLKIAFDHRKIINDALKLQRRKS